MRAVEDSDTLPAPCVGSKRTPLVREAGRRAVSAGRAALAAAVAEEAAARERDATAEVEHDSDRSLDPADVTVSAADAADAASAVDDVEPSAGPSGPVAPPPAKRGRPRKTSLSAPSAAGSSDAATVAPPAAAARTKPRPAGGPGSAARGRRRRRRPATGFVSRRPLVKRRPVVAKRSVSVSIGRGMATRVPRKRRKVGDLSIDMKEPFSTSPGKTRTSRSRCVEAGRAPAGSGD